MNRSGPRSEHPANVSPKRAVTLWGGAFLVVALLFAYGNHFHNAFHFDDSHTIENNSSISSLRNIWLFFRDASTFSALPSNQSYRPLVSTLLAIDYWLGRGLHPLFFHLSVFAMFIALTLSIAFLINRLLEQQTPPSNTNRWIAIAAAACYGLHPANADTVNYIIAMSDVMSTLGVLVSFNVYFALPKLRRYYLYVLPAAITILAKPPAAAFPVLFGIFRLFFPDNVSETRWRRRFNWLLEVVPGALICGATLWFVQHMTPQTWVAGAANARNYLITQPYVTLLYFKTFFWPSGLSADYDLEPFLTTDDSRFWIGFLFIVLFVGTTIVASVYKRSRIVGFGLLWFLIALLPTSLFPLAEVMNDHRTFFPYIGLIIALAGVASLLMAAANRYVVPARVAAVSIVAVLVVVSACTTWNRNKVWKTEESLWRDVSQKSPGNARGLMNYGVALMARGEFKGALDYFHRAFQISPKYSVLLINMAIAEDATQSPDAERHFQEALKLAPSTPDSYTYYARWLLRRSRTAEAHALLQKALEFSPTDLTAQGLLVELKSRGPLTADTPEAYLNLSLHYYHQGRYAESIDACRAALALRSGYAEAWNNIGAAYNRMGEYSKGEAACEEALRLNPEFQLARNNLQFSRSMLKRTAEQKR